MEYKFDYETEEEKKEILETNYNLYLIKEADHINEKYLLFTDEEPTFENTPLLEDVVKEQGNKISILEAENKALNTKVDTVKFTHSDLILDMDFRIMDIEDSIGIVPTTKLFMRIGENNMNSTFMLVLDKIEMGNYSDKNEIEGICDRYLARNRINSEEYDTLMKALDKKELEKN